MGRPTIALVALVAVLVLDVSWGNPVSNLMAGIEKRGLFSCVEDVGEECAWYENCCGDLTCQRDNGGGSTGFCTTCIAHNGGCHSDYQCCEMAVGGNMQCDKEGLSHSYGKCRPPRANGEVCYELVGSDTQCESGYCDMNGLSGVCKDRPE